MDLNELNSKRAQFLVELYKQTMGSTEESVNGQDVGAALGFEFRETDRIVEYLIGEYLVERPTLTEIAITHEGVKRAEEILQNPTHDREEGMGISDFQQKPIIFISHQTDHKDLAVALKIQLEHAFEKKIEVFVSSDVYDIPGGAEWQEKIRTTLPEANVHIVLCTLGTLARPWINFEAGSAWTNRIPIISASFLGLDKGQLPKPYDSFQNFNIDETFPDKLLTSLEKHLNGKFQAQRRQQQFYAALKAGIDKISSTTPESSVIKQDANLDLEDGAVRILDIINNHGGENVDVNILYREAQISKLEVDDYLDTLRSKGLIKRGTTLFSPTQGSLTPYALLPAGRRYLIQAKKND